MHPRTLPRPGSARSLKAGFVLVALISALGAPGAARADTQDRLTAARAQMVALEQNLADKRAELVALQNELGAINGQLADGRQLAENLSTDLDKVRANVAATELRIEQLQSTFDSMTRAAYIDHGASMLSAVVGSEPSDLGERLTVMNQLADHNLAVADQMAALKASLQQQTDETRTLIDQQQGALHTIQTQQQVVVDQSVRLQAAMTAVENSKKELLALAVRLKAELGTADIDQLMQTLGGKDSVSYGQWARLAAAEFKAPSCKENLVALVAWQAQEGTDARWNPLATTYDMPGATTFNWVGVKNYTSLKQGLTAIWLTLQHGWSAYGYGDIVVSLRHCAPAEDTAAAIAASSWCGCGSYYVVSLIDNVRKNFNFYSKI